MRSILETKALDPLGKQLCLATNLCMLVLQFTIQSLFLAYTKQAWILNFKSCNATFHYVNAHTNAINRLWACSPYLCAQILIDPFLFSYLPRSLWLISLPLSTITKKVLILVRIKSINVRIILWFNLDYLSKYVIRFEPRTSFFTPHEV